MIKILIVDDEILVRTNLKMMIQWKDGVFALCGEASNGAEALEIIKKQRPQIVLTDMKMPVMDGLALTNSIRENYPSISIIALSNYDDFGYVRGVLKNGAVDYILKHNISKSVIAEALSRAKENYEKNNAGRIENENIKTQNNISVLKSTFIVRLLTGLYRDIKEIEANFSLFDMCLDLKNLVPIIMMADSGSASGKRLKDRELLEYGILNITKEILNDSGNGEICIVSASSFCIILSFKNVTSEKRIDDSINSILWRIKASLKQFLNISVNFSVGKICKDVLALPQAYEQIEKFANNSLKISKSGIVKTYEHQKSTRKLSGLDLSYEKQLMEAVKLCNREKIHTVIGKIFGDIEKDNLDVTSTQIIFTDLFGIISGLCKKHHIEQSSVYSKEDSIMDFLMSADIKSVMAKFEELFYKIISKMSSDTDKNYSGYIKSAVNCILNNYNTNLSQQSIADQIGISSSYLSTLFKNEVGVSFTEFVTTTRLENARKLFESGERDIHKVTQLCGFFDYFYFFKVFKKKYNVTPNEFIKQQSDNTSFAVPK